jgi:phosphoribosylanthranilate isomerase
MTKVKICGITNLDDALVAYRAGADFLGFIFAKESKRRIEVSLAKDIIEKLPADIKVVALFVNEEKEKVNDIIGEIGRLDLLQFHGDETPAYCRQFRQKGIIKAIRVKGSSSLKDIEDFKDLDFILLDNFDASQLGGTGKSFDWNIAVDIKRPVFISGGLNPENAKEVVSKLRPFAVDVSSGVEKYPGKKDSKLVERFIAAAKSA